MPPGSAQRSMSSSTRPASGRGPAQHGDRLRRRHATALERRDDAEPPADRAGRRGRRPRPSTVSPGLDDRAGPARADAPRAAPSRTRGRTSRRPSSAITTRPSRGRALHHRVVDRDRLLDRLVGALEHRRRGRPSGRATGAARCSARARPGSPAAATGTCPAFQATPGCAGQLARPGPASASPRSAAAGRRAARRPARRARQSRDQVAVLGGRSVGLDAERHERVVDAERARRELVGRRAEDLAEAAPRRSIVWSAGRTSMTSSSRPVDRERRRGRSRPPCCGRAARSSTARLGELVADEPARSAGRSRP